MFKQVVKVVSYLVIALFCGIAITLIVDQIDNVAENVRIRHMIEGQVRNAVASFRDSAPDAMTSDEVAFVNKYAVNVMGDKIVVREQSSGRPVEGNDELLFLFTLHEEDHDLDLYLRNTYLKSELAILDIPDYISGIVTTIIVFAFIMSYTEYKKRSQLLQQQFETKNAEMSRVLEKNEALALLGRMSASLAHELKTPLSTISNLVHVLPSRYSDERFMERFVTLVREELDRTQQLIDNLLAYGKDIEVRSEEWIAIRSLLQSMEKRYQVTVTYDEFLNAEILGDPFYLNLLFLNLIRNSREAGADNVSVSIHCSLSGSQSIAEIHCEDNGTGFPESTDLNELTNPFVTSRSQGGGLGLYLAKKIITAHDGKISLYRTEKGAGVNITLPGRRIRTNG